MARYQAQLGAELAPAIEVVAFAHRGYDGAGCCWPDAAELHKLSELFVLLGNLGDMFVLLANGFIHAGKFTQDVANHGVAPAW